MQQLTRRNFIKLSGILGVSTALSTVLTGCDSSNAGNFSGRVLIIGAGAAGMSAGYLLAQRGIEFDILEATDVYGGRFRVNKSFANFSIPLGAEWLHVTPSALDDIINDSSIEHDIVLKPYNNRDRYGYYEDGEYSTGALGNTGDRKFIGSSWFDFYEEYIIPTVLAKITFNTPIAKIDYSGDEVVLTDQSGVQHSAAKVIVTIPLRILQLGEVEFSPTLTEEKQEALEEAKVWSGMKAFIEFSEKFFPTFLEFPDSDRDAGQRLFYDVSYGQETEQHVLGLFSVGDHAERYINMSDEERIRSILSELDEIFDGAASASYVQHIVQDWNSEPYARGAYLNDYSPLWISEAMATSIDDKLYFAGTSYTCESDWGSVHTAAQSARDAVDEITG